MSGSAAYMPFEELLTVLGEADAVRLVSALGGDRLYVPVQFKPNSAVVKAIGQDAADIFSKHIATGQGGMWVELPRGGTGAAAEFQRRLAALCARDDLSERDIARMAGVTTRAVRYRRAKLRSAANANQLSLF